MKKKTLANGIMVAVILVMVAAGCLLALHLKTGDDTGLGSAYEITEIPGNALITAGQEGNLCTITILCDTILENLPALEEEKLPYVPKSGVILPETTVSFGEGETVFQVLQKVCTAADIQLEYSWTPLYDSYYVEGINHLYEFDCGVESGWMYKVNDWFPNYGCSRYQLRAGDTICWVYTCNLGIDVGGYYVAAG